MSKEAKQLMVAESLVPSARPAALKHMENQTRTEFDCATGCRRWIMKVYSTDFNKLAFAPHELAFFAYGGELLPGHEVLRLCSDDLCCAQAHLKQDSKANIKEQHQRMKDAANAKFREANGPSSRSWSLGNENSELEHAAAAAEEEQKDEAPSAAASRAPPQQLCTSCREHCAEAAGEPSGSPPPQSRKRARAEVAAASSSGPKPDYTWDHLPFLTRCEIARQMDLPMPARTQAEEDELERIAKKPKEAPKRGETGFVYKDEADFWDVGPPMGEGHPVPMWVAGQERMKEWMKTPDFAFIKEYRRKRDRGLLPKSQDIGEI